MSKRSPYCVVGGGLLGMTLAIRLAEQGWTVSLYEAAPSLGGLASVWQIGGFEWDKHYHVILASDSFLRDLLRSLNLEDQIEWVSTKTGFFIDKALYPFTSPYDFLRFPALNPVDKARLLMTIALNSRRIDGLPLEKLAVADYLTRLSGKQAFEKFWLPLLRSKLGEEYKDVSAAFIWATIRRLTAARRAGIVEQFGYVRGGYRTILNALQTKLQQLGIQVYLGSPVQEIQRRGEQLEVVAHGMPPACYDGVAVTTAPAIAVSQCPQLTISERQAWSGIRYQGIICASLITSRKWSPYYLTNICDPDVPFTGIVEMTSLVSQTEFQGKTLVYLPRYTKPADPLFSWTDSEIQEHFLKGFRIIHPSFKESDVEAFQISRVPFVFPLPTLHYSSLVPPMATSVSGLSLINSSHITQGTLNVNDTVNLANQAALQIKSQLPIPENV